MARIDELYRELAKRYHPDRCPPEKRDRFSSMMVYINLCRAQGALDELERLSRMDAAPPTQSPRPTPPPPPEPPAPQSAPPTREKRWHEPKPTRMSSDPEGVRAIREEVDRRVDKIYYNRDFPRIELLKECPVLRDYVRLLDDAQTKWNDASWDRRKAILRELVAQAILFEFVKTPFRG